MLLPAPLRPTRPIFSPGRITSEKSSMTFFVAAVGEIHVVEAHLARGHRERLRVPAVDHLRPSTACSCPSCTVPMCSNSEDHLPHHPVRDAVQAQRHRGGAATAPTPTAPCVHSHSATPAVLPMSSTLERLVDDLEAGDQPHLAIRA